MILDEWSATRKLSINRTLGNGGTSARFMLNNYRQ